uniref:Acyl-CoA thioesterase 12 n=1 Tax=Oncorhynchus mykiss TaxID=8022 RepID=A0A8C7S305_ONCMY
VESLGQIPAPIDVQMCQSIQPRHADHQGDLSTGQLLKWMDTIACLTCVCVCPLAERHAGTAVGQVITITVIEHSPQGIRVSVQDVRERVEMSVCVADSTFVGKPAGPEKVVLRPVENLGSAEEQLLHSLASERRRLYNEQTFSTLWRESVWYSSLACNSAVSTAFTHVESVELVLPPHANHHGNTSGRQILAWMENAATVAARYPLSNRVLWSVDMFRFRGPSSVGNRLVFKAVACNCEEWTANKVCHINSAFLIYQLSNTPGDVPSCPSSHIHQQGLGEEIPEVDGADEEETVYHIKCPPPINGGKSRDFVFPLSRRQPCDDKDNVLKPCVPGVLPQPGDVRRVAACNLAGWSKSREETASTRTTFPERDTTHTKPESDFGIDTIGRLMILTRHL